MPPTGNVVVVVDVVVVVVVLVGHAAPAGSGLQISVSLSLSTRAGLSALFAIALMTSLPAFLPAFFVLTTIDVSGPHGAAGVRWALPGFTFAFLMLDAAGQLSRAWF